MPLMGTLEAGPNLGFLRFGKPRHAKGYLVFQYLSVAIF
jgi:hypothetical protein